MSAIGGWSVPDEASCGRRQISEEIMQLEKSWLVKFIGIGLLLQVLPVGYAQTCSNQTLKGSFGYSVNGTVVTASGPFVAGPFAAVGRIKFDGKGGAFTVRTFSDNGSVFQHDSGTGTYTL